MDIRDATGGSYGLKVNSNNQAEVSSACLSKQAYIAKNTGEVFSWTAASADIDANDTALLVANVHTSKNLHITKVYVYTDVAAQIKIHCPTYPTLAGTTVTGVCLNRAKSLDVTNYALAYQDETGNTAANIIKYLRQNEVGTDQFAVEWDFGGSVILGYHQCIAVDLVTESAAFECSIEGYYE